MGLNGFHIDKYLAPRTIRQCCLAGSSKTAPRIFIFSVAIGADHSFYVKTIETHAPTFLTLNILGIGRVKL